MTVDIAALRTVAEAATPGKRMTTPLVANLNAPVVNLTVPESDGEPFSIGYAFDDDDAAHIAAFDRDTCLALLANASFVWAAAVAHAARAVTIPRDSLKA
jgi:hypothetical protein